MSIHMTSSQSINTLQTNNFSSAKTYFHQKEACKTQGHLTTTNYRGEKKHETKLAEESPKICAFCFKENDESSNEKNDWVECPQFGIWTHWECDRNGTDSTEDCMCSICSLAYANEPIEHIWSSGSLLSIQYKPCALVFAKNSSFV